MILPDPVKIMRMDISKNWASNEVMLGRLYAYITLILGETGAT